MGRPKKPRPTEVAAGGGEEPLFPVGAEVEVRSDDVGFLGSFYEATIAGHLPEGHGYVVAYATLLGEDGGDSPLQEAAAAADVRPRSPAAPAPGAELAMHEMVEAFHNEGWWAGVVSGVPPPPPQAAPGVQRRLYAVSFPTSREVLEFEAAALRRHLEFEDGRWVPAAEADNGDKLFRVGSQIEVSRSTETFGESWNPATVLKVLSATNLLVQYRHVGEDGELVTEILDSHYIRPARTSIHMDSKYRFAPSSHVEVFNQGSWWPGVILEVLGGGSSKQYVVKMKGQEKGMDEIDDMHVLTVENTQLRPRYDWDGKKWVRCSTKRPANKRAQSTSGIRPVSPVMMECNDNEEIRLEHGSYPNKKVKKANVVLGPISSFLVPFNGNNETRHKPCSCPNEMVKKANVVLALESQKALSLQPSIIENCHLKYDSSLSLTSHLEVSSSQRILMPSALQTEQLQASLFGVFGQLRPLPQGPVLGMQSLQQVTDQENQSTGKGCGVMAISQQKNFSGITFLRSDLSKKKRKERIAIRAPERLGQIPKIMQTKKRIVECMKEEASNGLVISKDSARQKHVELQNKANGKQQGVNDAGAQNELPIDITPGCEVSCIDSTMQKDNEGSHRSVVVDKIELNGKDDLQQEDHSGAIGHGATKVDVLTENAVLSNTSTLENPGDANMFSSDSPAQDRNKASKADEFTISAWQESSGQVSQRFLVMADDVTVNLFGSTNNSESAGQDQQHSASLVECAMKGLPSTEGLSRLSSPAVFDDVVLNLSPCIENCETNKQDDIVREDHHGSMVGFVARSMLESQHANIDGLLSVISSAALKVDMVYMQTSTEKCAFNEQHDKSRQGHASVTADCVTESSHFMENSAITQLSFVDRSKSTEAEPGGDLTIPKDVETTPISKYAASREYDSYSLSLQTAPVVRKSIMVDPPSESFATNDLPFVKTSPMWAQIEAMEVFGKVPQRPNFVQLQNYVPEFREGMALGLMISFANVAESIKRLHIHDEKALFEDKMRSLSFLEGDGFDVKHLRSRVETLLHIRNNRLELQGTMEKLKEKLSYKEFGDQQIKTQISILGIAVCQLEQQANLFRYIRRSLVSQKASNSLEISKLKMEASELEQSYLSVEQRFGSIIAAPW